MPPDWEEVTDAATADIYYHNKETGVTDWEHPTEARYKALYQQLKRTEAEHLEEEGKKGVRETWGGVPIALHSHTHTKALTGQEARLQRATDQGRRRQRAEELVRCTPASLDYCIPKFLPSKMANLPP